jgi:hypothetical protein
MGDRLAGRARTVGVKTGSSVTIRLSSSMDAAAASSPSRSS